MKIACILGEDFEDSEFRIPFDRLRAAGHEVELIGAQAGDELSGKKGKEHVTIERGIDEVRASEYAALLIPGGYSPDHLRADDRFVRFVKDFERARRPIFAVCHGPQLFISAGLQRGRRLTAWPTVQADLREAGAIVEDEEVVVDGNWVTSRKPDDLEAFAREALRHLGAGSEAHPV